MRTQKFTVLLGRADHDVTKSLREATSQHWVKVPFAGSTSDRVDEACGAAKLQAANDNNVDTNAPLWGDKYDILAVYLGHIWDIAEE